MVVKARVNYCESAQIPDPASALLTITDAQLESGFGRRPLLGQGLAATPKSSEDLIHNLGAASEGRDDLVPVDQLSRSRLFIDRKSVV